MNLGSFITCSEDLYIIFILFRIILDAGAIVSVSLGQIRLHLFLGMLRNLRVLV